MASMKKIVILGGGFAGISAAKKLLKYKKVHQLNITLIDKKDFQLFTPALYEVATSEAPKQKVIIPYKDIFDKRISVVKGSVHSIDNKKQIVKLSSGEELSYDFLLVALGSEPAYYNIPGLKEHSITLKTLEDALKIKNTIKDMCCKEGVCKRQVKVVIGGGGFAGTELAAELLSYKDRLAVQNHLERDCLDISVIQGSDRLLKELDEHVSVIAQKRMKNSQMHFCFGAHIKEVTNTHVLTDDGKKYPYDLLLWTGGVMPNNHLHHESFPLTKRGQIAVNTSLNVQNYDNVFAAGDISGFVDPKSGASAPGVAQVAEEQGRISAENIIRTIVGKPLLQYHLRHFGYIVPLRGKYASAEFMGNLHLDGFLGWVLEQLVGLYYLFRVLPWWKAFRRWNNLEVAIAQ